jgi:hypothetical protein
MNMRLICSLRKKQINIEKKSSRGANKPRDRKTDRTTQRQKHQVTVKTDRLSTIEAEQLRDTKTEKKFGKDT